MNTALEILKALEFRMRPLNSIPLWAPVAVSEAIKLLEEEPAEFTKDIRDYIEDFIYAENKGVAMQHAPRCLERDLIEACDLIDYLQAENKTLKEKA